MVDSDADLPFRCGYVSIVGRPNVGKSTLFNALVGERLSIVTQKPQTTRNSIMGILTSVDSQMLFLDTPGLLDPAYRLQEYMLGQVRAAFHDADILLCVVDATDVPGTFDEEVRDALLAVDVPRVVAMNKVDLIDAGAVEQGLRSVSSAGLSQDALPVSARTGINTDELLRALKQALPAGPQLYPEDTLTQHPERFFVAEFVREEIFTQLRQELPYSTAVRIEEFREDRTKDYIRADILVERESQKGIVIGGRGRTLRSIGKAAREKIEAFLGRPVYLDLQVKVLENWRKKDRALRGLGYE